MKRYLICVFVGALLGCLAYFYRDKIGEFVDSLL